MSIETIFNICFWIEIGIAVAGLIMLMIWLFKEAGK